MIKVKRLSKKYGQTDVLRDISVNVEPGAVTVVMGPSGAGKSTLVRLISLVESSDSGEIWLEGKKADLKSDEWTIGSDSPWPLLTAVFQQLFLWPHMTLEKNIRLPSELQNRSLNEYNELVEHLDIAGILNRYPNQVSIGQRQRAALARALLLEPKYLILDEITAALDVEQVSLLVSTLTNCLQRNIGLMIVTHHLGFAKTLIEYNDAGTFIFLEAGRVIELGNANSFLSPKTNRVRKFLETARSIA